MKEQRAEAAILKNRLGEAEEELLKYSASPTPSLMTALKTWLPFSPLVEVTETRVSRQ